MKLAIELVPETAWYSNLRTILMASGWNKVRQKVLARANDHCEICNAKVKRLECHEIWHYDDETLVQSLEDVKALCRKCHRIKHFGLSLIKSQKGEINIQTLEDHFTKVNECTYVEFKDHVNESFRTHGVRSREEWNIDISNVALYLDD